MAIPTIEDIREYNPWERGEKFDVPAYKREGYTTVLSAVRTKKFIVAITGLRRVGKTVMMKQIGNEIDGNRFFFSFEEDIHANYDALKSVIEMLLRLGEKPLIFLDEIGRINGWAGLLKKYHDQGKARFVVSGSSSIDITKGKESLAGRIMEYTLHPWGFKEFLGLKGNAIPHVSFKNLEKSYMVWKDQKEMAIEFLKKGGFPELHDVEDRDMIRKYITSTTLDKIIFEDLPKTFGIDDVHKLYDLMEYVAKETGNVFVASHVGDALELSKDTVKKYLLYLRYAYLVEILPIEGSTLKSFKKPKKVYASSPAISYGIKPDIDVSRLVESAVHQKLREVGGDVFFYRDAQKREVDFTGNVIAEVKWKESILKSDLKNLLYYMKKKNKKVGFVVTKDEFDAKSIDGKEIYFLPLDFFLALE